MDFVTSIEKASEWGVTKRMVNYWCAMGKIAGVMKEGQRWMIPADAIRPDRYKESTPLIDYLVRIVGRKVGIGNQNFATIREKDLFYVDKTSFIEQWWEREDAVTLITRPRRFGKTLNLSMIECFFSTEYAGRSELFDGLKIWEHEKYRELQGTYPVIFLTLAGVKENDYDRAVRLICFEIEELCKRIKHRLDMTRLSEEDSRSLNDMCMKIDGSTVSMSIKTLSGILSRYFSKDVIILLDEYDTPMIEAYFSGYWDKMIRFMGVLFNNTFKSNPYMHKAILTGITRISKESLFSDMNHLYVATMLTHEYETAFGFTESEVFAALSHMNMGKYKKKVKEWYDGFTIGRCKDIYNPWSITRFIRENGAFDTYWANTSSNELIDSLVSRGSVDMKCKMENLIQGMSIQVRIDERIDFATLETNDNSVWGLLFTTGYLKQCGSKDGIYSLALTNEEVKKMFIRMFGKWFECTGGSYDNFQRALINADIEAMNYYMNMVTEMTFSYFDCGHNGTTNSIDETERFYHGFVLGLIANMSTDYYITSNRESGLGRYNIMLESKNKNKLSYIIEFKVFNKEKDKSLEECAYRAIKHINDKQYEQVLISRQIDKSMIRKYGFAFAGKKVLIKSDDE